MAARRVYLGVHYPSDIAAGALLGTRRAGARRDEGRHRRHAQRGQVLAVQRADQGGRRGGELPVHDDRAERRRRARRRRAPRAGRRASSARRTSSTTRSTSTTSRASSRGAHEGEGLGNQFLANIRETDAIVHVVRAHRDDNVIHPEGRVDPLRDIETIETELIYADLEQAERRLERVAQARPRRRQGGGRRGGAGCESVIEALQAGSPRATVPVPDDAPDALRNLGPLTAKPVLFVANVDEGDDEVPAGDRRARRGRGRAAPSRSPRAWRPSCPSSTTRTPPRCARTSASPSPACSASSHGAFALLRPDRVLHRRRGQARAVLAPARRPHRLARRRRRSTRTSRRASSAPRSSAGTRCVDAGGYAGARDRGTLRLEGRDYVMRDGDVITVKFTP